MAKSPKFYYIRYLPKANVDYCVLLGLQSIAEYDTKTKTYSIVQYRSMKQLAEYLKVSYSTVSRILSLNGDYIDYSNFLSVDKKNKTITLLNDFAGRTHIRYVAIPIQVFQILRKQDDDFLIKYYLYLKYYYSYAKSRGKSGIDNTAQQFLEEYGYSVKSGSHLSRVSYCNAYFVKNGVLSIDKSYTDTLYLRNWYRIK